ncbi:MAG TPA: ABC transporter permease [Terriglobales bacterium]|nr:ABC transporter permease [Terriglobales bacterium]
MATRTTTMSSEEARAAEMRPQGGAGGTLLAAATLWWREVVRFYRQKARVVGVIASPLLFWVVIGSGFGRSFRDPSAAAAGGGHYLEYFFPGALIMIVLFTSIFAMMSVIEDRKEGFLLSVMVAPVHRTAIVLGKVLGGTTLAAIQGMLFLVFAPFVGIRLGLEQIAVTALVVFLVSFALTALGFAIAWPMDSSQAFHAVVNLFLIPLWLLSGALFPLSGASGWMRLLMRLNPLTYGVDALRVTLFPGATSELPLWTSIGVLAAFALVVFALAFLMANRRRGVPA